MNCVHVSNVNLMSVSPVKKRKPKPQKMQPKLSPKRKNASNWKKKIN
jgi:hypothetical protein